VSKVLKCLETGQLYVYQETGDRDVDVSNLVEMLNSVIDDTVPGSRHDNLRVYAVAYPGDKHEDAGKVTCPVCGSEPGQEGLEDIWNINARLKETLKKISEPNLICPEGSRLKPPSEIKECMLCGGDVELLNTMDGWYVTCQECQMSTKVFDTPAEAIDTWNNKRKVDSFV